MKNVKGGVGDCALGLPYTGPGCALCKYSSPGSAGYSGGSSGGGGCGGTVYGSGTSYYTNPPYVPPGH